MIKNSTGIILIIIYIIFFINCNNKESNNFELNINNEMKSKLNKHFIIEKEFKKQNLKKRNILNVPKLTKKLNISEINIYQPWLYKYYNGDIYFLDYSSNLITRMSITNFNDRLTFGKGKGRGPGELIQPWDFDFIENKIFIIEGTKNTIEVYSINGEFIKTIEIENINPYRIFINRSNKTFIIRNESDFVDYYYEYDLNGEFIQKFCGPLVNKNLMSILYHEGDFIRYSDDSFYQTPRYLGIIGFFKNNSLVFTKETIDGIQNPEIIGSPGSEHLDNENTFATSNYSDSNDKFVVLQSKKSSSKSSFLDFYKKNDFEYLFSFNFDKDYSFRLNENFLIIFNFETHDLELYDISNF